MKSFVAAFAALVLIASVNALTSEQLALSQKHAQDCSKTIGVTTEEVAKLKQGDFTNKGEKIQCFSKCFLEKAGLLKNDVFQAEVAVKTFATNADKAKVEKVVNACKNTKGANGCETAFKLFQCYTQNKAILA